jgi:uncharacterized protein (TIGR03083 family)
MTATDRLLREQWHELRTWLADEGVLDHADQPAGLGEWTVRDLVVHLGYGLRMIADLTPATDEQPIAVTRYIAGYAPAQQQIADDTTTAAAALKGRELAGIDEMAADAWRAIGAGLPPVVRGRRGPLRSEDFLWTRLLEVVVHGDDLHRVIGPVRHTPVQPASLDRVSGVLADAYEEATGRPPPWTGLELVRVATGRAATDDPAMPLLS